MSSSAVPVLKRTLRWGGIVALAIGVIGSVFGFIVDGGTGVVSALIGTAIAVVFLGVTAVSIIIATRYDIGVFFGIVMGAWLLKFVVFIVLLLVLRDQPWINTIVLFITSVTAIVGTLVVDMVAIARSRMPYVSDVELPGEQNSGDESA